MNNEEIKRFDFEWVAMLVTGIIALVAFLAIKYWIPNHLDHLRARAGGQRAACSVFCVRIGKALEEYAADNNGSYPPNLSYLIPKYIKAIPTCPAAKRDTYSGSYQVSLDSESFTFFCSGNNHPAIKAGPNLPMYNSNTGLVYK